VALGTAYRRTNRTAKAIATYETALALGAQSEQLRIAAESFMGVGAALYDTGELEGAIANYARALELFERLSTVTYELSTLQSLAAVTFESGDLVKARELAERCKARAIAAGVPKAVATADLTLARLAEADGNREEALRIATGAAAALADIDSTQLADALTIVGSVHEALGNTAEADRAYGEAIGALSKTGVGPAYAQVTREYAEMLSKRGESARAYELLKTTLVERVRTPAAPPKRRARARGT
jgi:tetratricopeptide (TPR) repeat protein